MFALWGCSADPAPAAQTWEVGGDQHVCAALHEAGQVTVMLSISKLPNMSGINIVAGSLSFVREGRFEPDVRLAVEGQEVSATAIGVETSRARGLLLRLDPLPLIDRHPDGFRLSLNRADAKLVDIDLANASGAFEALRACAENLPPAG